jgi:type VI secretion system secreted protein Hcp
VALSFAALTVNGAPLGGDVTQATIGGVDVSRGHIEVYDLSFGARVTTAPNTGASPRSTGRRQLDPLRLTKPMDRTTPLLYQALSQHRTIAGDVLIFDTNPEDGTTRHRFTIRLSDARITAVASAVTDPNVGIPVPGRPYESVELVPHTIAYIDEVASVEYEDHWTDIR